MTVEEIITNISTIEKKNCNLLMTLSNFNKIKTKLLHRPSSERAKYLYIRIYGTNS